MKIRQFLKAVQKADGLRGLASSEIRDLPFADYRALISLTSYITFSCIVRDNTCGRFLSGNPQLCCAACRSTVGHFAYLPRDRGVLRWYAHKFHNRFGFWRPRIGCILPRGWRSVVCTCFSCHEQLEPIERIYPPATARFIAALRDSKERGELVEELQRPLTEIEETLSRARREQKTHCIDYSPFFAVPEDCR